MGHDRDVESAVFISYRSLDSQGYGDLLYFGLAYRFGEDLVFLDCESIRAGTDFVTELLARVRSARVVLAVIGPDWLSATDPVSGRRRIDDPNDWIRRELVESYTHGVRVIPVLIDQTELPSAADLPSDIAALSRGQALRLRGRESSAGLTGIIRELVALDPVLADADRRRANAPLPPPAPRVDGETAERTGLFTWVDRRFGRRFSRFDRRYRDFVSSGLRFIDLKGLATVGFYTPELDEVYVDLSLTPSPPHDVPQGVVSDAPAPDLTRRTLSDFLDRPEPAVIAVVAAPGMGKTSLLLHSVRQLCTAARGRRRSVPILLYLRDHVSRILADRDVHLADVVRDTLGDNRTAEPRGWFEWHLAHGDCVVHLDGLDEVAGQAVRRALADWVERQVARYPKNDYVITSRPHGYRTARINGATVLRVLRMTDNQVNLFVGRWYRAFELAVERYNRRAPGRGDPAAPRAAAAARDLLERLTKVPALYELTANPMLLTMIMNVHRFRGELPGSRVDLYDEICKVMLGRRQEAKQLPVVLAVDKKETVLRGLAFDMMRRHVRDLRQADVLRAVEPILRRVSDELTAPEFLMDVGTSGYLVERENGRYAFAHQTFQEYLAAAHILQKALTDVLTDAVDDVWWRETTLLYAARSDADPIIRACLDSDSVTALSLAFDCEAQSSEIAPRLRDRLKRLLDSALDPDTSRQRRRLMAGVMVTRHLRRVSMTTGTSTICAQPISTFLYRLCLLDTQSQPWDEPWLLEPGDEQPIVGVYGREAAAFAHWANTVAGGERVCRLPTRAEIDDPVVRRAITAATEHRAAVSIWVQPDAPGTELELWTSADGVHPYTVDGDTLAEHVAADVDGISAALPGLLLLQAVTLLPALARAYAVAVASGTPLHGESTELTRVLRLAGELDDSLELTRTLELVHRLDTHRPSRTRNRGGGHELYRAIATSSHILPAVDSPPTSEPHGQSTASAGDGTRAAELAHELVQDLSRKLHTARASIGQRDPAYVLAVDRALGAGIGLAHTLDQLLRDAGAQHDETLPRAIARHRELARGDLPDHGLELFLGTLLSRALCGAVGDDRRDDRTFPAEVGEFVIGAAALRPMRFVVSPDTLAATLGRALARLRATPARPGSAWTPTEVADRLADIAMPVFTWQRTLTPADATAIRLAALCLAAEADDARLAALFREIAAGVTLLERRTDGRAPLTETIVLAIV